MGKDSIGLRSHPDISRPGIRDTAIRDIRGYLRHRSEILPTTDPRTHNVQTMLGVLRLAFNAYAELNPEIAKFLS